MKYTYFLQHDGDYVIEGVKHPMLTKKIYMLHIIKCSPLQLGLMSNSSPTGEITTDNKAAGG